jgi:CCR4-NOT transcription complex subunit 1
LEVRPFGFALDVAALASRREYLNLDKWLADHATAHGEVFIHAVIEFLESKVTSELRRLDNTIVNEHKTMAINPATITIFIKLLRGLYVLLHNLSELQFSD